VGPATPLPGSGEIITAANLSRLARVAQWGKGKIIDLAYAPDGSYFVVGSEAGLAVYNTADLFATPSWISFETPWVYDYFVFSSDGQYLKFGASVYNRATYDSEWRYRAFDLSAGNFLPQVPDANWIVPQNSDKGSYSGLEIHSLDGTLKFVGGYKLPSETTTYIDASFGEVYEVSTTEMLYALTDDIPAIFYRDRTEPIGCDIYFFSYCGNAVAPVVMSPYLAGFSAGNRYLAVIYQAPELWSSEWHSYIRLYDAFDGALIRQIGGAQRPVVDFAFDPTGAYLVAAYLDGSIGYMEIATGLTGDRDPPCRRWIAARAVYDVQCSSLTGGSAAGAGI
jgi:WD40 repeat protein